MKIAYFFVLLVVLFCFSAHSQSYYRLKADFSIKEKLISGKTQLSTGKVYFDVSSQTICYYIAYPAQQIWLIKDSSFYKILNGKIVRRLTVPNIASHSVFLLALNGTLSSFGLAHSAYKPQSVTQEGELVITCWVPPSHLSKKLGKIYTSNKSKTLSGVVFKDLKENIITKCSFDKYLNIEGLMFPHEIIQVNFVGNKESYQLTSYKNVILNDFNENDKYNFVLPKL
jgi:hypothetical protein